MHTKLTLTFDESIKPRRKPFDSRCFNSTCLFYNTSYVDNTDELLCEQNGYVIPIRIDFVIICLI